MPEKPTVSAVEELRSMIVGFRISAALSVAADLGLSDLLGGGPRTAAELADAVSADADTLLRLLEALAAVGVYSHEPDGTFANTPLGDGLRSDASASMRPLARTLTDPALWAAWGHLGHSVRTGDNAFEALHGIDVWTHRERTPEQNAIFNDNMTALSSLVADAVAAAYDFSDLTTVVDVGGGKGVLLETVLARHEHLSGTVFDLAHVVAVAPTPGASESVAARWRAATGSFFDQVPAADAYLLKSVLHDWPDDECVDILRTCGRAMNPEGVVLVVEVVLGRPGHEVDAAFSDLNMLVLPGGRERSEQEYAALFAAAGLRLTEVIHTDSRMSILEGRAHQAD
jgi:2-polyprenyl-3-methyl-5-hydroxy-6-metoxy-1,4-benzoquinol methylase